MLRALRAGDVESLVALSADPMFADHRVLNHNQVRRFWEERSSPAFLRQKGMWLQEGRFRTNVYSTELLQHKYEHTDCNGYEQWLRVGDYTVELDNSGERVWLLFRFVSGKWILMGGVD
jgi:hypothetical protein